MPRSLFIVSRDTPYLVHYMRAQFSGESEVEVLLDRRSGVDRRGGRDRRATDIERARDRRSNVDRRQRRDVDQRLREAFHALVTVG